MQRLQAFKYELRPNGQQQRQMRRFAGSCRFVFNKALALQKERYEQGQKKLGYAGLCKLLTEWRGSGETHWLKDAPVHPLQQTLKDLERAYANFFAQRAAFPRFKKKGQHDSLRYPDPKQFKLDEGNGRIFLPKHRLDAAAPVSACAGQALQRHGEPVGRQMVCLDPDRAGSAAARAASHIRSGHRHGRCPLCHLLGRQLSCAAGEL